MARIKYKSFVSNRYVFWNMCVSILFGAFLSMLATFGDSIWRSLLCFSLFGTAAFGAFSIQAPFAYQRIKIDQNGVRCGRMAVSYADIQSISVVTGYVPEWRGVLLMGSMYENIYIEDMICINCEFAGFRLRKAKGCMYVPRNARSERLLAEYCAQYAPACEQASECVQVPDNSDKRYWRRNVLCLLASVLVFGVIAVSGVVKNPARLFQALCLSVLFVPMIVMWCAKGNILYWIKRRWGVK